MTNSKYRAFLRCLNTRQHQIVMANQLWCKMYVRKMRKGEIHPGFRWYLSGPGGVGKSFVIQLIRRDVIYFLQQTLQVQPDEPLVLLTAPTGLAAFNINGITLHSAFMLHRDNCSTDTNAWEKRSTMQLKLQHLALCVIDEISMVGAVTFQCVCDALKKIKQSTHDWGHVAILAAGDFYQLPPVGQCPVYMNPRKVRAPGDMAPLLWDDFVIHELTDVVQQKDTIFADALNRIQKQVPDKGSADDIMLKSRELNIDNTHPDYPCNAMHVYAQNEHCANWNSIRLDAINDRLYTYVACDVTKD